jgi:hypothetical protein
MKGAATTATHPPDEFDEAKVEVETVVWDQPEAEQKNKADEISVDDGAVIGIQSIMEAAAVVSLSGVSMIITAAPANAPKKSNAKKPSPSKRKTPATKAKKPAPPK